MVVVDVVDVGSAVLVEVAGSAVVLVATGQRQGSEVVVVVLVVDVVVVGPQPSSASCQACWPMLQFHLHVPAHSAGADIGAKVVVVVALGLAATGSSGTPHTQRPLESACTST